MSKRRQYHRPTTINMPSRSKKKLTEKDLAVFVVTYLQNEGWEVYQEVQIRSYGSVADIIAVRASEVMVVETKTSFGLAVLGQAHYWKRYAHYVAIAVPKAQNQSKGRFFGQQIAWKFEIGIFLVKPFEGKVIIEVPPQKNSGADTKKILEVLTEQHKTFAKAGSADGQHLTRFKITCQELTEYIKEHPGVCLKKAIKCIKHHYKKDYGAAQSLGKQISQFDSIPNLYGEWDSEMKCLRLYFRSKPSSPFPPQRKSIEESVKSNL